MIVALLSCKQLSLAWRTKPRADDVQLLTCVVSAHDRSFSGVMQHVIRCGGFPRSGPAARNLTRPSWLTGGEVV